MTDKYPITQQLVASHVPEFPRIPYRRGKGMPEGVVFHATETPGRPDTASNEAAFETSHWQDAFVHFFVDHEGIIQIADTDYEAWGAGYPANSRYIHIELCMYDVSQKDMFLQAYDRYVWLGAKLLHQYGLKPTVAPTGAIWSHSDVTRYLGGTNHTDPIEYLQSFGIDWSTHVRNVQSAYYDLAGGQAAPEHFAVVVGWFGSEQQAADAAEVIKKTHGWNAWAHKEA